MLYVCMYILYVCIPAYGNVAKFSITKKSES